MSKHSPPHSITLQPGWDTVQAIVTAAAIVASADGHIARSERRSLLRFLSHQGILARHGRTASVAAFDDAARQAADMRLDEACAATLTLRAVAERPGAPLVAQAAVLVALADGVSWPQEIALVELIRERVGLRPAPRN